MEKNKYKKVFISVAAADFFVILISYLFFVVGSESIFLLGVTDLLLLFLINMIERGSK